jgi:hypothetical protein
MKTGRRLLVGALLVLAAARLAPPTRSLLPESLTNEEFWALSTELSEPGGTFRSENLLSNERMLQHVIPALARGIKPGGAYLGVGPEQNFTYIASLEPALAFIVDIRRGNLQLHLMYKALFELSADRVEFVSRLFSRPRPPNLASTSTTEDIFRAFIATDGNAALVAENLTAIRDYLTKTRKLPLTEEDLEGIQWIHQSFYFNGPQIQYSATFGRNGAFPTYAELMTATDGGGSPHSFLSNPDAFAYVKRLHARNLILPIVGDFAGTKALRGVGQYLKSKQAIVGAFYLSNVEQYLGREGRWNLFCENVAALPLDESSSFIRSIRDGSYGRGLGLNSVTGNMLSETRVCRQSVIPHP